MVKALYTKVIKFGNKKVQVPNGEISDRLLFASFKRPLSELRKELIQNPDVEIKEKSDGKAA